MAPMWTTFTFPQPLMIQSHFLTITSSYDIPTSMTAAPHAPLIPTSMTTPTHPTRAAEELDPLRPGLSLMTPDSKASV